MKRTLLISLIAGLVLLFTALPTFAQDVSFSGTITPGTALTGGVPESNGLSCATLTGGTRYFVVEEFQVPVSGKWSYIDTSYIRYRELSDGSLDLAVAFYTGSATTFDPNNPSGNGCFASFDDAGTMDLIAGVTYSVVVSTHFAGESGNYDFSLTQPLSTTISATDTAVAAFPNDDDYLCDPAAVDVNTYYVQSYEITPASDGYFYFVDLWDYDYGVPPGGTDAWIAIYDGGFDPSNPSSNCAVNLDQRGVFPLLGGRTYTVVVTTYSAGATGTLAYVLLSANGGSAACPNPLPAGSVVRSIPAGAPLFYQPDLATQLSYNLPAGTWWTTGTSGDFTHVWIACTANQVWVPTNAVAP